MEMKKWLLIYQLDLSILNYICRKSSIYTHIVMRSRQLIGSTVEKWESWKNQFCMNFSIF